MSEGFLSRWSRLKRVAPEPAAAPPVEPPVEPELAPDELEARLAELPAVDDIGPQTDVTRFLEKWVPKALRDAALRKAWTSDPRIAGFIEVADFQWDWNVPGGAPGCGPLEPGFDAVAHVERMFREAHAPFLRSAGDDDRDVASHTAAPDADVAPQQSEGGDRLPGTDEVAISQETSVLRRSCDDDPDSAPQQDLGGPVLAARRRHGGALPE